MGARLLAIGALVTMLLFAGGGTALAGRDWCATDPILVLSDGAQLQWTTAFPSDGLASLTGPVTFRFVLPSNAGPVSVLFPGSPAAEKVVISYSGPAWKGKGGMPVRATVVVPASTNFKTVTTINGNVNNVLTFGGASDEPIKTNAKIDLRSWQNLVGASTILASFTVSNDATIDVP